MPERNSDVRSEDKGLGWVAAQVILMLACAIAGWSAPGQWTAHEHDWFIPLLMTFAGAFFGIAGVWILGANRTIYPEPRERSVLIRHGIYGYVRHPLYSSVMLLAFAWALWRHSMVSLVFALILAVFLTFKARNEEGRLLRKFPDYAAYRKTTRRFLPWLF